MTEEPSKPKPERQRSVRVYVLLIAMLGTAVFVSAVFLVHRKHVPNSPAAVSLPVPQKVQTSPDALPANKSAILSPLDSPATPELTDEELFKRAAPSVILLREFDESGQPLKLGSGFIAASDGIAITNYHVIRGAYSGTATFQDGSTADVTGVLGYNAASDVAVVRLAKSPATPLTLADSDTVQVGDRVAVIGSPFGLQNTISDGLVSAFRSARIQTSAPISPGSSGGPVFNSQGKVIGIAVASIFAGQNLNFVVPINQAKSYLTDGNLTTLADISKENTVVVSLLRQAVNIPARQLRQLLVTIDENRMDDARLQGSFQCSGGIDSRVQVLVLDTSRQSVLYDSGHVRNGVVNVKLPPGKYDLILSNKDSIVFPRTLNADFSLQYVK